MTGFVDTPGPPAPPPGPGVQVPFSAPPAERDRRRMWITLGVGGGLLALCCVGGIFGVGALIVQTSRSLTNQAKIVVTDYLTALQSNNYGQAYDLLCANRREQITRDTFEETEGTRPKILDFTVYQPRIENSDIVVPTVVVRTAGETQYPDFTLVREGQATTLKICGITQ